MKVFLKKLKYNFYFIVKSPGTPVQLSKRGHICQELLSTERNYVSILRLITEVFSFDKLIKLLLVNTFLLQVFKAPLEKEKVLSAQELKVIFRDIPPILAVHEKILEEL